MRGRSGLLRAWADRPAASGANRTRVPARAVLGGESRGPGRLRDPALQLAATVRAYLPLLVYETQSPWFLNTLPLARKRVFQPSFLQASLLAGVGFDTGGRTFSFASNPVPKNET